jgi:hypothetical protein
MDDLRTVSSGHLLDHRQELSNASPWQDNQQDTTSFYRPPRSRATTPTCPTFQSQPPRISDTSTASTSNSDQSEGPFDINSALSEVSLEPGIDYSFREADCFYGIPEDRVFSSPASTTSLVVTPDHDRSEGTQLHKGLIAWLTSAFNRKMLMKPEKGFQVRRSPRPIP